MILVVVENDTESPTVSGIMLKYVLQSHCLSVLQISGMSLPASEKSWTHNLLVPTHILLQKDARTPPPSSHRRNNLSYSKTADRHYTGVQQPPGATGSRLAPTALATRLSYGGGTRVCSSCGRLTRLPRDRHTTPLTHVTMGWLQTFPPQITAFMLLFPTCFVPRCLNRHYFQLCNCVCYCREVVTLCTCR